MYLFQIPEYVCLKVHLKGGEGRQTTTSGVPRAEQNAPTPGESATVSSDNDTAAVEATVLLDKTYAAVSSLLTKAFSLS